MIQSALNWVRGEQTEGIAVLCLALVITGVGALLPRLVVAPYAKSPTGHGIAIGLMLFALLAVAVDYFSKERADIYYREIINTL